VPVRYEWADGEATDGDEDPATGDGETDLTGEQASAEGSDPDTSATGDAESDDERDTKLGLIAQEVADVVPEAVVEPDDEDGYLGLSYESLVPVLVDAVKQQQDRIDDLEAELERLQSRIDAGDRVAGEREAGAEGARPPR